MNHKDDSFLNTGMTSAAARANKAARQKTSQEKAKEQAILTPVEQIVNEVIAAELGKALNIQNIEFDYEASELGLKAELLAIKKNVEFIKSFQKIMQSKLRTAPTTTRESSNG